jgi:glutamyl-Q tRNA(Asp) synthetase
VIVTRFAPSPNGSLHLGHAYAAIAAHDLARERGGRFLLRIEDIDGARSRPELIPEIIADLEWLGLGWDGEVVHQSSRLASYAAAGEELKAMGLL